MENKDNVNVSNGLRNIARPFLWSIIGALSLNAAEETIALAFPYIQKLILDTIVSEKEEGWKQILILCATLAGVTLTHALLSARTNIVSGKLSSAINRALTVQALTKQVELPMSYHAKYGSAEKMTIVGKGTSAIQQIISTLSFNFIPQVIRLVCVFALMGFHSPTMCLIVMGFMIVLMALARYRDKVVKPIKERQHVLSKKGSKHISDVLSNMRSVQIFGQALRELGIYNTQADALMQEQVAAWGIQFRELPLRTTIRRGSQIAVIIYGYYLFRCDLVTLGTLFMLMNLSIQVSDLAGNLTMNWMKIRDEFPEAEDFLQMLGTESDVRDKPDAIPLTSLRGAITFENVSFSYPERNNILKEVSMEIRPGMTVALVGQTGSGKSTLTTLLTRGYDVDAGVIRVDGKDIRDVRKADLWARMAIVPQEAELFQRTIAENIAYGKPDATFEEIVQAAKLAHAHEFILQINTKGGEEKSGYNSVIGERGVNLSGGQKQRLAIARAVLKNPAIMILDEATSHIDVETEQEVQVAIDAARKGRTTIVIAHRLSTVKNADMIFVMQDGEIVERGTHKELAQREGSYYARLLRKATIGGEGAVLQ